MPKGTQPKFTSPSRAFTPRVKKATQPMNMAHTGRVRTRLAWAADAAVAAATAVKIVKVSKDCGFIIVPP